MMMNLERIYVLLLLLLCVFFFSDPVAADDQDTPAKDSFDSNEAIIHLLEEKEIISNDEALEFIRRHREKEVRDALDAQKETPTEKAVSESRLTTVFSNAAQRMRLGGDIRIRYQADLYDSNNINDLDDPLSPNPNSPEDDINTTDDRHRGLIRARLGLYADVNDQIDAVLRLATGNMDNPVSTNDTLGDYLNKDDFLLDLAYIQWQPIANASSTDLAFGAGRLPNPFYTTSLVWDPDVNPEGVTARFQTEIARNWDLFTNNGIFSIQEVEQYQDDKWMYAVQAGTEYTVKDEVNKSEPFRTKFGVAYYDYQDMIGQPNEEAMSPPYLDDPQNDPSAPMFYQGGNTLKIIDFDGTEFETGLAADYNMLDLTGEIDIGVFDPTHVVFLWDYVENIGYDKDEVYEDLLIEESYDDETTGYSLGLAVGNRKVRSFMEWMVALTYKHLERDAVLDAFTDSDFPPNAEGWILQGDLGLFQNVWISSKWISSDEISPEFQPVFFGREGQFSLDTFQFEVNTVF
jgi:hypothetical protein